jgi:prevent-host-death family protein
MDRLRVVPAGVFKQKCLALIDEVARTHRPVAISKRGKVVAQLAPVETDEQIEERVLARLREGDGGMLVDEATFLGPTEELAGWKHR